MDEIMGTSTINQDYYWAVFKKTPDFESLRGRDSCQRIERNNWVIRYNLLLVVFFYRLLFLKRWIFLNGAVVSGINLKKLGLLTFMARGIFFITIVT